MKRYLLLLMISLFFSLQVFPADAYKITQTMFLPKRFYVGDIVEMRIRLKVQSGISVTAPAALPSTGSVLFKNIDVLQRGEELEVKVVFSPYQPGTISLPPLTLGGIVLTDIKVHANSIFDEKPRSFAPPMGQVLIPSTRLLIGIIVGIIVIVPVFLILGIRLVYRRFSRFLALQQEKQPYKKLVKTLHRLRQQAATLGGREFFIILSDDLRSYLSSRLNGNFVSATSTEIAALLKHVSAAPVYEKLISDVFIRGDLVKFGGKEADLNELSSCLNTVEEAVSLIEGKNRQGREQHADV